METILLLTQSPPFRCCQFPGFLIKILENPDILSLDITGLESSANINIWQLYLAENVCIHIHIMLVGQDIKMVINIKYIRTTLLPCTAQLSSPFWKKILLLWFSHLIWETGCFYDKYATHMNILIIIAQSVFSRLEVRRRWWSGGDHLNRDNSGGNVCFVPVLGLWLLSTKLTE